MSRSEISGAWAGRNWEGRGWRGLVLGKRARMDGI